VLLAPIAEGGMGAVWLAERRDGMMKRKVALKLPHWNWVRADLAARMAREREILATRPIGDEDEPAHQITRAALNRIIRPRVEEMLELVRDRLNASGFAGLVGKRMVLTGGGSQLTGLVEAARKVLARNVRVGRPLGVAGMPDVAKGPAFATAVGLLIYPQVARMDQIEAGGAHYAMTGTGGYFSRVGRWIRDSF
jgi:cell division protein FtsA